MFTVLYSDNGRSKARLGLAVSKKHCRTAVNRNRLKRVIRESFRQHAAGLAGHDVVVLNQLAAQHADNEALFRSLERHWQRINAKEAGPDG